MKIIVINFYLMLSAAGLVAQEWNQYDSDGERHGKWVGYYDSGDVRYNGEFDHGEPTGIFTYYYQESQRISISMKYVAPGECYSRAYYDMDGDVLMAYGKYLNQKKDSIWSYYDPRGILSSKETYKEDKLHGERAVFYLDGQVYELSTWEDSIQNGPYVSYYEDGSKNVEGNYVGGCWDGQVTYYHNNGVKELQGWYVSCVPHGYWYQYDDQGNEERVTFYRYGEVLEGDQLEYYLQDLENQKEQEGEDE